MEKRTPTSIIRLKLNHIHSPHTQRDSQNARPRRSPTRRQKRYNMSYPIDKHIRITLCTIPIQVMNPDRRRGRGHAAVYSGESKCTTWRGTADVAYVSGVGAERAGEVDCTTSEDVGGGFSFDPVF